MKKWKPSPPALVRAFEDAVRSLRGAERRKMFGYPAIFVNGNMFAGLRACMVPEVEYGRLRVTTQRAAILRRI